MPEETLNITLASSRSTQISLEAIREGDAGLNQHRQAMLNRVPEIGDCAFFRHDSLQLIDLAYLTAKTGHEFAILRGKDVDILFHGDPRHCDFPEMLAEMLMRHQAQIVGHSHPGEDEPHPSRADRMALLQIGQKKSVVVSGRTGRTKEFTPNPFEDFTI